MSDIRIVPNEANSVNPQDRIDDLRNSDSIERSSGAQPGSATDASGVSFGAILGDVVEQANKVDQVASKKVDDLARGASDDLHGTMIATKEADISVHLVGTIRNKLLDAFQEIWRTSV